MPISDFTPEYKTIEMAGKPAISVRGLNLNDIATVVRWNKDSLEMLFAMYQEHEANVLIGAAKSEFLMRVLTDLPDFVYGLLAMAADEPAGADKVALLPFVVQLDALAAVLELSFEESGGPKNFVATLQKLLSAMIQGKTVGSLPKAA